MKNWNFGEYQVAKEPSKRERAYAWMTAIGLQKVDGLEVSDYLLKTARRNIEGEISGDEAVRLIDQYYEAKDDTKADKEQEEADKVSARINNVVRLPGFHLSPAYFLGLHKLIFNGVFSHAGNIRNVELTKKEWVLNGESVVYTPSVFISDTLEYEFNRERCFSYGGLSSDEFISHLSNFISSIWQIHAFREGNTRTVAVFTIKYLQAKGYETTNALFEKNSWYFRNALVRANYENQQLNVEKTLTPLEEFFKVLLCEEQIDLKNRFLHVDYERKKDALYTRVTNKVTNGVTDEGKKILQALKNNPHISYEELAKMFSVSRKTIAKRIKNLKAYGILRRIGSNSTGSWVVSL